jgi:hypothetical protein
MATVSPEILAKNHEMVKLLAAHKLPFITRWQYKSWGGKSTEIEFLLEPHDAFIQDYRCLEDVSKKYVCYSARCARLFPSMTGLVDWSVPCVSRSLSDAMVADSRYVTKWIDTMDQWIHAVEELEPQNWLPIHIFMHQWYTDILSGKLNGVLELQRALTTHGTNENRAYQNYFRVNQMRTVSAILALVLLRAMANENITVFRALDLTADIGLRQLHWYNRVHWYHHPY